MPRSRCGTGGAHIAARAASLLILHTLTWLLAALRRLRGTRCRRGRSPWLPHRVCCCTAAVLSAGASPPVFHLTTLWPGEKAAALSMPLQKRICRRCADHCHHGSLALHRRSASPRTGLKTPVRACSRYMPTTCPCDKYHPEEHGNLITEHTHGICGSQSAHNMTWHESSKHRGGRMHGRRALPVPM